MYRISLKGERKLATWQIILIILVGLTVYAAIMFFRQKRVLKKLNEEEFRAGYRKAQLIDVREANEFDAGHILGARNIPLSQMKTRLKEIRPDQPVYFYCQSGMRSGRAAQMLSSKGYQELYHLEGGFKKWTGKVKKKN
ncbi:rhodanese-like domain-containing protein [Bacillus sp. 2205SS5-2]|uniref:rhodanese-like domain-containing protein n=1 Tax=Bacillus sp. 2205SS5-2 TaxID=3109031 RepID=UPI003007D207